MGTGVDVDRYLGVTLKVTEAEAGLSAPKADKGNGVVAPAAGHWALNAGSSARESQPELELKVGSKTFSKAQLKQAIASGMGTVAEVVVKRARALKLPAVWGPNIGDATYLFRIGEQKNGKPAAFGVANDSYGLTGEQMTHVVALWNERGLPTPSREELAAMQLVNFYARFENRADILWVPKHYPGGNHLIEVTEKNAVSFADAPHATEQWINQWDAIFRMKSPPIAIMLAHAQYAPESFGLAPGAAFTSRLLNKRFGFKEVPASLNPLIVAHLHEVRGYPGLTVGDWYNMGAIRQFASQIELDPPAAGEFEMEDAVVMMLAIEADVDMVGGQQTPSNKLAEYMQRLPNFAEIDRALTQSLQRTTARLKAMGRVGLSNDELAKMSFADRLALKSNPRGSVGKLDAAKPLFVGAKDQWNRQGLLTLIQRVAMIEALSSVAIAKPPANVEGEEAWADAVLSNPTFKKFNSAIPWDSEAIRGLFEESFQVSAGAMARDERLPWYVK